MEMVSWEKSELFPKTLEPFFLSWGKRIPRKSLILIARGYDSNVNKENKAIIEKYQSLGIVKVLKGMNIYLISYYIK